MWSRTRSQSALSLAMRARTCSSFTPTANARLQGRGHLVGVEQLAAQLGPPALERHRRADLVEHLDERRDAGLDRVLGEDPLGKRVEGADGREVEAVERRLDALTVVRVLLVARGLLEARPQPVAQLGSGPLGEGDRRDGVDGDAARRARASGRG